MNITTEELHLQSNEISAQINTGREITITYHGKALAKIVPINDKDNSVNDNDMELFGMWKDRDDMDDVEAYVRNLRKGRYL
jgi:antitoxin (DNA-binding transcriptional repressor) of toxin-antitoxin stability system